MGLSDDLISQFAKLTKEEKPKQTESTAYGVTVEYDGRMYVKLDGSELLTPVSTTTNMSAGERVIVLIKNHSATVTGNITSPSATGSEVSAVQKEVDELGTKISEFEIIVADQVTTEQLNAEKARIDTLTSDNVKIKESLTAAEGTIKILTSDNVTINEHLTAAEADIDDLEAYNITVKENLEAVNAEIENLKTTKLDAEIADITYATISDLEATNADINNLEATYASFEIATTNKLNAAEGNIADLQAGKLDATTANITYAKIADLNATNANVTDLTADIADIDTLIFGSATGSTIQSSFSNAVIAQLGDAQIKSAMIESIAAGKIKSGDIITNNVRVKSEDGSLLISDETMQISDDNRVRVQIGKDSSGDYSINIWDVNGNLMFSKGGITDSAIKDAIIRNDMVSDTANIAAHKLDIDSLFEEINGSTNTIKSTQIYIDDENQTLDVAFKAITEDVGELQNGVSSQGTAISVMQGQIESKIWQQDISSATSGLSETTDTLTTQYEEMQQEVDGLLSTVASHTSQISNKADNSTVTAVNNKVSTLEQDLDSISATVSNHTSQISQKADNSTVTTVNNKVTSIEAEIDGISATVISHTSQISQKADNTTVTSINNKVTELEADLDGVSATVSDHTSQISKKADNSTVTSVTNRVATLETGLSGFQSTASKTYATQTALAQTDNNVAMLYGDPTNYSNLNSRTADQLGYTLGDDNWYTPKVLQRDTKLSNILYECFGGEKILVEYEYSSSVKGITEMNGTESGYANVGVGIYCKKINGASDYAWLVTGNAPSSEEAPVTKISQVLTIPDDARYFTVNFQLGRWPAFTGSVKVRNIRVSKIDALTNRVSAAETAIEQNTDAIELRATKSEVSSVSTVANNAKTAAATAQSTADGVKTNLANNYYTSTQTDAKIKVASDSITSTVSSTYATKTDLSNVRIGGRNLFENSANLTSTAIQYYSCPERTITTGDDPKVPSGKYIALTMGESDGTFQGGPYLAASFGKHIPKMIEGHTYTVSVWAKCSTEKDAGIMGVEFLNHLNGATPKLSTEWQRYRVTGTYNGHTTASVAITFYYASKWSTGDVFYLSSPMVEYGDRVSDWKPAPEDMATEAELTSVGNRVTEAETKITQNSNSITSVASRTSANESAISSLEQTADGLTVRLGTAESDIDAAQATANTAKTNAATAQSTADTAKTNAATAQSTANAAKTAAANAQSTADTAKTNAATAQSTANTANSTANTAKTNAATAQSTANTANTTANTALTNTKLQSDVTNYSQLNDDTAEYWGFTADTTADGHWYTMKVLSRDKFISGWHRCTGSERFRVSFEISTSCKGNSTNGGTDSVYRGTTIGLYGYDDAGTSVGIQYATRITGSANAPATVVSSVIGLSSTARKFRVFVQTESYGNFSGSVKIRNVRVEKIDTEAAKTATNYLNFSNNGLVVGNHTANSLGKNVLIDSDSVDIRNNTTKLASFSENLLSLGLKAENSSIELCGGAGKIIAEGDDEYDWNSSLKMKSTNLSFESERNFQHTHRTSTDGKSTAYTKLSASTSLPQIYADTDGDGVSTHVDDGIDTGIGLNVEAQDTVRNKRKDAGVSVTAKISRNNVVTDWDLVRAQMYARDWTSNNDNFLRVFPEQTTMSKPLVVSGNVTMNSIVFSGKNKILWSGGYYMTASHTATLSAKVSAQPNGIVLVFSEYRDGAAVNNTWHNYFVPKQMVSSHSGSGHCFQLSTSNLAYYGTKYLYISDTKIVGHDNNNLTGTTDCGITKTCNRFVLRYVIGV